MTIEVEVPEVIFDYAGPGDYPFDFEIMDIVDVAIKRVTEGQLIIDLLYGSDFTVAASPGIDGGTVTIIYDDPAGGPYSGTLEIFRVTPMDQQTDYDNNDPFDMDVLERSLDKLTMICQDLGFSMSAAHLAFHYRGVWAPGVTYFVNDIVQYPDATGNWYASNMEHDSSTTPDQDSDNWVLVLDVASVFQDTQAAELAAAAAAASELAAENWAILAEKWAQNPQNVPVEVGLYSAYHWARVSQQAAGTGISWVTPYIYGEEYPPLTMVKDGEWTMVSNKTTSERAAPQPVGDVAWVFDGTFADQTVLAKQVIFGARYTLPNAGYIYKYRVYVTLDSTYSVYLITDPLGNAHITTLLNFVATTTGWVELNTLGQLVPVGSTFDVMVVTGEPDPTPVSWNSTWNYLTPNNASTPNSGQVLHPNKLLGEMLFSKNDSTGTDRETQLLALTIGDKLISGTMEWNIQSVTDNGTYVSIGVSPTTQTVGGLRTFEFQTVTASQIPYNIDTNYYQSAAAVSGLLGVDVEYETITPDDNAYGVDIEFQDAQLPVDWDVAATSGDIGGTGAPTGVEEAPEDSKQYARKDAAWDEVLPNRYGVVPLIGVHTPLRTDTPLCPLYQGNDGGTITVLSASNAGFEVGDVVSLYQNDANEYQIVGDTGVFRTLPPQKQGITRGQGSIVSYVYTSNTTFLVYGDLKDA